MRETGVPCSESMCVQLQSGTGPTGIPALASTEANLSGLKSTAELWLCTSLRTREVHDSEHLGSPSSLAGAPELTFIHVRRTHTQTVSGLRSLPKLLYVVADQSRKLARLRRLSGTPA